MPEEYLWPYSPCEHDWKNGDVVVLTYPAGYHRSCAKCNRVEITNDHQTWRECFESRDPYGKYAKKEPIC